MIGPTSVIMVNNPLLSISCNTTNATYAINTKLITKSGDIPNCITDTINAIRITSIHNPI
jgi:hypothetical protein